MKRSAMLKDMIEGVRKDLKGIGEEAVENPRPETASTRQASEAQPLDAFKPPLTSKPSPAVPPQRVENVAALASTLDRVGTAEESRTDIAKIAVFKPELLGSRKFREKYGVKYAYVAGSMVRGISSVEMIVKLSKAGMLSFLGTGGMRLDDIDASLAAIGERLVPGEPWGANLLHAPGNAALEDRIVDLYLKRGVETVEASAYMQITPALVRYHAKGLSEGRGGSIERRNRIIAKLSRPEIAEAFLAPAPEKILERLLSEGAITQEEARLSRLIPVADDISVEADSGGHTDGGVALALFPSILRLRDDLCERYRYPFKPSLGLGGGLGSPGAVAAAFMLGADYVLTGSINQCTVEAGISSAAKDLLQQADVQDTEYAPAGDMFELGAKVQVLKKGTFFAARANKLYDLYRAHESIDRIDPATRKQIEEKYLGRSFESVYESCKDFFARAGTDEIARAEKNPKLKMALIFRWYFHKANSLAVEGSEGSRVDYQIHCGPALGAFNQWVKGGPLEDWKNRHVDAIALRLLDGACATLGQRFRDLTLS